MKQVLVLGSASFSGRHFENFVHKSDLNRKCIFTGIDKNIEKALNSGIFSYVQADLNNFSNLRELLRKFKPYYIINFIGVFSHEVASIKNLNLSFQDIIRLNVGISEQILKACTEKLIQPKKILLIGSASEYGLVTSNPVKETDELRPNSYYGLSKVFQTHLTHFYYQNYELPIVIARPFNLFGEGASDELSAGRFANIVAEANDGDIITVGNIDTKRDYVNIKDAVSTYWKLLEKGIPGEIYNVCTGLGKSGRKFLQGIIRDSGKNLSIVVDPKLFKERDIPEIFGCPNKILNL